MPSSGGRLLRRLLLLPPPTRLVAVALTQSLTPAMRRCQVLRQRSSGQVTMMTMVMMMVMMISAVETTMTAMRVLELPLMVLRLTVEAAVMATMPVIAISRAQLLVLQVRATWRPAHIQGRAVMRRRATATSMPLCRQGQTGMHPTPKTAPTRRLWPTTRPPAVT